MEKGHFRGKNFWKFEHIILLEAVFEVGLSEDQEGYENALPENMAPVCKIPAEEWHAK